jgi:hypothetical protein
MGAEFSRMIRRRRRLKSSPKNRSPCEISSSSSSSLPRSSSFLSVETDPLKMYECKLNFMDGNVYDDNF